MHYFRHYTTVVFTACLMVFVGFVPCRGDVMTMKNGQQYVGHLISDDGKLVVFELQSVGITMTIRRPVSEVEKIQRDSQNAPKYSVVAISGTIGRDDQAEKYITADSFKQVLAEVQAARSQYVILAIDSPGGSVDEMQTIVSAIPEAKDQQFIAYVKNAYSAAAVIAMACPHIFMAPNGNIGAAVPFKVGPDGTPTNIEEKFQSAMRSVFRNAAKIGGHSPLWLRGMSEIEIELAVVERDGKPVVVEASEDRMARVVKPQGRILTLTAEESVADGLSDGIAASFDDVRAQLGIPSWNLTLDDAAGYIESKAREEQRQVAIEMEARKRAAQRQAYIDRISPELSNIDARLIELDAQVQSANLTEQHLIAQQSQQLQSLGFDYRRALMRANANNATDVELQWINNEYKKQCTAVNVEYDGRKSEARERANKATLEATQLRRRRQDLVNSIPQ